ncbi:MAG: tRNA (adenine-N1)-methyltransferase [Chloroflexi bacterium]|nr:tRNA (adenine-N1)-methyltransferase [Chloroflexota bacterium]
MAWNLSGTHAQAGDLAQLAGLRNKSFIIQLVPGAVFQTHRGVLNHDDLIGLPWGSQVFSHQGSAFFLLQPSLGDLLREIKRNTQILYPKEIGFILVQMGIGPGQHVLEAGTGSGALTTALAYMVGKEGHVTSYEARPEFQRLAQSNLKRAGLEDRVTFKLKDIQEGFEDRKSTRLILDVANPYDYMAQVRAALKPGGFFGSILPTTNQVAKLLIALRQERFAFLDVCEIMLRYYKPEPDRLRPTDRMVAHTGYLIFGRPILLSENSAGQDLLAEINADREEEVA